MGTCFTKAVLPQDKKGDEVVFNKTGDHMRGTNLQANFTTDHLGEFAKGARFCVPGPELSVR